MVARPLPVLSDGSQGGSEVEVLAHGARPLRPPDPTAAAAHRQKRAAAAATTSSGPRSSNLPSNWDRYDAEGEAEDPTAAGKWSGQVAQQGRGLWVPSRAESGREQWKEEESTSTVRFGSCGPDC